MVVAPLPVPHPFCRFFFRLLLLMLICSCNRDMQAPSNSLDYIPENGFLLIKINNLSAFQSDLKNNSFLGAWKNSRPYTDIANLLQPLKYMESNSGLVLSLYGSAPDSLHFLLAAPDREDLFYPEKAPNHTVESLSSANLKYQKYELDGQTLYGLVQNNIRIISSSDSLIRKAVENPGQLRKPDFHRLIEAASEERNAGILVRMPGLEKAWHSLFSKDTSGKERPYSEWMLLDFNSRQDFLGLQGLAVYSDSTRADNLISLFRSLQAKALRVGEFAPGSANAVMGFSLDSPQVFAQNQRQYKGETGDSDRLFETAEEAGLILDDLGNSFFVGTYGLEALTNHLHTLQNGSETYRDHDIWSLQDNNLLESFFGPLAGNIEAKCYAISGNSLIFSENLDALKALLENRDLGQTFDQTEAYAAATAGLADESTLLLVASDKGIHKLLDKSLATSFLAPFQETALSDFAFSAQLNAEETFFHISLLAQQKGKRQESNGASPQFTVTLDAPLASDPQFVRNHRTNEMEVVVQDEANVLYLISAEGNVLWKKTLNGRVRGKISQVDLYRNGRLQLAFTTDNQFLILDRNGKEVPPFSMSFPGAALNPLAVFDYENNRNYRFVLTQGKKIKMFNNQGKEVSGFTYTQANAPILSPPVHIRLGNRDYLVFQLEDGSLEIRNRVGQTRIPIAEKFGFSENRVFAYNDRFALTDTTGTLFLIDEKGQMEKKELGLERDHGMDATTKSMTFMSENILTIREQKISMDYGLYTHPGIFYLYDKLYFSITDLQAQKVYLFDSNAELLPGFPVSGSSAVDLADADQDRIPDLVVRTSENALVVYRLK